MKHAKPLHQLAPNEVQLNSFQTPLRASENSWLSRKTIGVLATTSILLGTVFGATSVALAQDSERAIEEVVVTGSRISRPNVTSSSPVTVLEARAFAVLGAVDTIDLVNQLPQAFVDQDASYANGANGTSTIDLRGLGAIRTLVLANGKRLPFGSPTQGGFASDVNLIPAPLVERVEIVTGGASAVYGSDAIAGVANFILKKNFQGFEIDALIGTNQTDNDSELSRNALTAVGEDPIQGNQSDNDTYDISAVFGTNLDDDRGNVTAYLRAFNNDGILQGDRDFARCALLGGDSPRCLGSNQGPFPTTFVVSPATPVGGDAVALIGADGQPLLDDEGDPITSGAFSLNSDGSLSQGFNNPFNFNPFNPLRREVERVNAEFNGYYAITDQVEVYGEFGFTRSNSPQVIAPSAAFGSSINAVNCDNPVLSAEQRAVICGNADINGPFPRDLDGDGFAQAEVRRRFVEGGPRTDDRSLQTYRMVLGLRGEINPSWQWDVFGQLANTDLNRLQVNQVTRTNLTRALDIVADPNTGDPICRSVADGTDPDCVPFLTAYDPSAAVDPTLASYVDTPTLTQGTIEQLVYGATLNGDLTENGIGLPWASDGLAIVLGTEFRRDSLRTQADGTNQSGNLVGSGGRVLPTNGETEVTEFFTEVQVPIIQDADYAKELSFNAAYRYSDYSSEDIRNGVSGGDFTADTYAVGLSWTPIDDVRFRMQFQRAIRAPNIGELFLPQNTNLSSLSDPCAGFANTDDAPTATLQECQRTGVTEAQYGAIPPDSGQLNILIGGNPDIQPEESDTFTFGVIVQPEAIPELVVTVDYYDIDLTDQVGSIPASFTLQSCLESGDPRYCDLVNRGPDGSLTFFPREQANIVSTSINIAEASTSGVDFSVKYAFSPAEDWGDLDLSYTSTYQLENTQTPLPGSGTYDCVGYFDQGCEEPYFEYRHIVNATWTTPWQVTLAANWRFYDSLARIDSIDTDTGAITTFAAAGNGDQVGANLGSVSYFDLTAFYNPVEPLTLRLGVRNLFDRDPPVLPQFGPSPTVNTEGNTISGTYEGGGRFIFLGAKLSFQ